MTNQQLGRIGEDTAKAFLECKGYRILHRNFRCRAGEIDLVALKGRILHFIEVKTRQGDSYGHPAESITPKKLGCMKAAACSYLAAEGGQKWLLGRCSLTPLKLKLTILRISRREG